ncbi:hypothetical protein [Polyangium sp. 15x6]|uniref:hypothetical protein n=1 Tax=Polyangium sp. 15x6 TaxID=3042687 RepID=UPI00249C09A5|nr:hypothetical protein [Polyangium sp. 15x6]
MFSSRAGVPVQRRRTSNAWLQCGCPLAAASKTITPRGSWMDGADVLSCDGYCFEREKKGFAGSFEHHVASTRGTRRCRRLLVPHQAGPLTAP